MVRWIVLALTLALAACGTTPPEPGAPTTVSVYATPATRLWLDTFYACGTQHQIAIRLATSNQTADIFVRLGEPPVLAVPAFQIGLEQVTVIVHPQNPLSQLDAAQVQAIFSGQTGGWAVWTFASGDDVHAAFSPALTGAPFTSLARLAVDSDHMRRAIAADPQAIGFLPSRFVDASVKGVWSGGVVPVLALTQAAPADAVETILACVQAAQ
jgi:DNA-binding transcriptional LysR family regulator